MRAIRLLPVLVAVAALAGCSTLEPAPVTPFAHIVDKVACGENQTAGRVPKDFVPVVAYICGIQNVSVSSPAPSPPPPPTELRGDFSALLVALAQPNDATPAHQACTAQMEITPALWLADVSGRAIRVAWPRNSCGFTKPGVEDALKVLKKHN